MADSETVVRWARIDDLEQILLIHKTQKRWLGHMPNRPFEEAILNGRLLVAERSSGLVGYLLFRVRKTLGDAAIVHLAVHPAHGGLGAGSRLVEVLLDELADLRRIVLACRKDFPAHKFWLRAGFEAIDERPGKSLDGKLLTDFERRLRQEPTLFDGLYESSQAFAVDLDVLVDLATERRQGEITRSVFQQLDQFEAHPMRTISLSNELIHHADEAARKTARSLASGWQEAHEQGSAERLNELVELVPDAEETDLRHVCDAEANEVALLLSRDESFTRAMARCGGDVTSVRVLHPSSFIDELMQADGPDYLPSRAGGLKLERGSKFGPGGLADVFLSSAGETKAELRELFQELLASPSTEVHCLVRGDEPVCVYSIQVDESDAIVRVLRARSGDDFSTVVRQALGMVRVRATEDRVCRRLIIGETVRPSRLERALRAEGFENRGENWIAFPTAGTMGSEDILSELANWGSGTGAAERCASLAVRATKDPRSAAHLERSMDPVVVSDSAMPAFLIPIKAGWADRLIGVTSGQLDIDVSGGRVGGLREHVYFRSASGPRMSAPFRAFWYRTAEGISSVFATSVVEQTLVASEQEVWGRFGGYGVLKRADLESLSGESNEVMALRFFRTRRLQRSISLEQLQAAATELEVTRPSVPYGPLRIDQTLHRWLLSSEVGVE